MSSAPFQLGDDSRLVSSRHTPYREAAPFVLAEDLAVHYNGRPALQSASMTINPTCLTAIVGPSGCGKSSFLMALNRLTDLLPGCRVSGRVQIGEVDVFAPNTEVVALRRRVGMIFQKPNPFPLSIRRNLEFPLREHGMTRREELDETVETALGEVGLWDEVKDRLDQPAQSLSGGQQQRLCIARALALRPEVLLLDEPCSALDPLSAGVVEDLISNLRCRLTTVVVTHNMAQARRIADFVGVFWVKDGVGTVVEHGRAEQVFEAPRKEVTAAYVSGMRG